VQGYTTHHTLRVTEQVHHHSVFQHGYAHAPHPAGEKPRQLESRDPQTTGIGMARGVDESFQTRSPVQQLLHPNRGLFGVDGHQPLVGEIVPLLDHVAGELLWAIVRRALYSEDFAGATAVHVDLAIGGKRSTTPSQKALGHCQNIHAPPRRFYGCSGTGPFGPDDQDVAANLFLNRQIHMCLSLAFTPGSGWR